MRRLQRVSVIICNAALCPHPHLMRCTKCWREREREAKALRQVRWQGLDHGHNSGKQCAL